MARIGSELGQVVRSVMSGDTLGPTDRDLLRRFAESGDEAAFAAVVRRHAQMVLGVCRRALPTVQDAEDACQATFLILARSAGAGRWQVSAANWLHTTARRVAARVRRSATRRAQRERRAAVVEAVEPLDTMSGRELLAAIDEELANLPPVYRDVLVLCYLEGLSREDAAAQLGVPAGTVKTRLERGRKRLAAALTRRGLAPVTGAFALMISRPAGATPPDLTETILATVTGPPPAAVATLAQGAIMNSAFRTGLIAVVVGLCATGLGVVWDAFAPAAVTAQAVETSQRATQPTASHVDWTAERVVAPSPVAVTADPPATDDEVALRNRVATARNRAIAFLKGQKKPDGTWEGLTQTHSPNLNGGETALVVLALLESGMPANDPSLQSAIDYLADLPPRRTDVVSLQTQVFAQANPKAFAKQIQTNADWLIDTANGFKTTGRLDGWGYYPVGRGDGSNTHFAVSGLHSAAGAGAKIDPKIWAAIREHYIRGQRESGGWAYMADKSSAAPVTDSMTGAALAGLAIADKHDKATDAGKQAFEKGLGKWMRMEPVNAGKHSGYHWMVTAELGRLTGSLVFKSGAREVAWYRERALKLAEDQSPDGSWATKVENGFNGSKALNAAFGLYFLGPPAK